MATDTVHAMEVDKASAARPQRTVARGTTSARSAVKKRSTPSQRITWIPSYNPSTREPVVSSTRSHGVNAMEPHSIRPAFGGGGIRLG